MIDLIEQHFQLEGSESPELLTRAMSELAEKPELAEHLVELGQTLSDREKEDISVMEQFNRAVEAVGVAPEIVHRAFDRYFEETMPNR